MSNFVGEFAPMFSYFAFDLFPIAFDPIPIHSHAPILYHASSAEDQRNDKQNQEDEKDDLRHLHSDSRYSYETQHACNKRYYQKGYGKTQHG
jgi:hypothetical protein